MGAQRVGISTDTVSRQAHFARQRSFDYPLLSDADSVVSELFGVRRGRLAKLRRSVVKREEARPGGHTRRRGLLARVLPVRRTTFVIDIDRTVLKVVANEVRASVHADEALRFLATHRAGEQPDGVGEPVSDWFTEPEAVDEPSFGTTVHAGDGPNRRRGRLGARGSGRSARHHGEPAALAE